MNEHETFFLAIFHFGVLAPLIFVIYCVILFLTSTNNSLKHSVAIK